VTREHRPRVYRIENGMWEVSCGGDLLGWFGDWWPAMLKALSHAERHARRPMLH
jgi:hypothetical protein